MAKRRKKTKTDTDSGFVWMLFGLTIGLVVAAAVYVTDRRDPPLAEAEEFRSAVAPQAGVMEVEVVVPQTQEDDPHPASRFDFFDILPQFEVVLPEVEAESRPERRAVAIEEPGNYVLQAGSFREPADAERRKANLALLGIESRLQRAKIDNVTYHRVIVGPTVNLDELNLTRRQIWEADIDVIIYRVPN
jgi:cell division protein FtsN